MSELLKRVRQTIITRRLFRRGQPILLGVSGGLDSMVLLDLLQRLSREAGWRLTLAHFNHKLRGRSSDADERLVRRTGEKVDLPVVVERAEVRQFARRHGLSTEMAARRLRHEFLARTAARLNIASVALAHHADDQVELFFLRLLRGSGTEGVAGMKWRGPSPDQGRVQLVRPLLDQPKSVLREYALEQDIRFREDASNELLQFGRNRIRHKLLPLLRREYQPALDRVVLRLMEIAGAEADWVTQAAEGWLEAIPRAKRGVRFGARQLKRSRPCVNQPFDQLAVAVQRRCIQLQLLRQRVVPNFDLVEALRKCAEGPVNVGGIPPGRGQFCAVRDSAGLVWVKALKQAPTHRADFLEVDLQPANGRAFFGGASIRWCRSQGKAKGVRFRPPQVAGSEVFDAGRVGWRIILRHWRPGDRFQPIGMRSAVKLQDFFMSQKVPRERRHALIVATAGGGTVFWVEGMRIGERFKVTEGTIRRLHWQWQRRNQ